MLHQIARQKLGRKKLLQDLRSGVIGCLKHRGLHKQEQIEQKPKSVINPLKHEDYFSVRNMVTIRDLFNARVHYGHAHGCRNHSMQPYIFGCRNGVDVINLDETYQHLIKAMNFLSHMVYQGGLVLFVMRSHIHGHLVERTARECGEYAHTRAWKRHLFLGTREEGKCAKLPDVCVFLSLLDSVNTQHIGIADCAKVNVASVGIADTNCDPSMVMYPIPGNDDTASSVELYCNLFKTCVLRAKAKRKEDEASVESQNQNEDT